MSMSTEEKIRHYQKSIDRSIHDKSRLLHCIEVLSKLPVTVQHLQITGIGRTVNALRKIEDGVGDAAKILVSKWKVMVANTDSSEEEDEACVPDVPECYESPDCETEPENKTLHNVYGTSASPNINSSLSPTVSNSMVINDKTVDSESEEIAISYKASNSKNKDKNKAHHCSKSVAKPISSKNKKSKRSSSDSQKFNNDFHKTEKHDNPFNDFKSSTVSDSRKSQNNKRISEFSVSSSSKDIKNAERKKRKHESSSSDGEDDQNRKKNYDEASDIEEKISFLINQNSELSAGGVKFSNLEVKEDKDEEEEKEDNCKDFRRLSSDNSSRKKGSSLKNESYNHKTKRMEKKHCDSIHGNITLCESRNKSNKDDKHSDLKLNVQEINENYKCQDRRLKESPKSNISHSSFNTKDRADNNKNYTSKEKQKKDKEKKDDNKTHKLIKKEKYSDKSSNSSKGIREKNVENKEYIENKECKDHKERKKTKQRDNGDGGIDCNSGTSFADALGMCTKMSQSKKKKLAEKDNSFPNILKSTKSDQLNISPNPSTSSCTKISLTNVKNETTDSIESLSLLSPNIKLEPLSQIDEEVDLASTLPEPSLNYKPLPHINHLQRKQDHESILTQVINAKNQRTKVYSGNKIGYSYVPTLYEMCIQVLIENIDALEFTGGVPYYILKPVLERATPDQLFMLEHHNPYLIEDSDLLWKFHCNKDFRTKQREEMETWREMYMRCLDEREAKLKILTANIKQSIDKSTPVRSTKLAYVDNIVKPPRNVLRKQAKYGTANLTTKSSDFKKKLIRNAIGVSGTSQSEGSNVPSTSITRNRVSSSSTVKKMKAPLMVKALQAIKGRYKR